MKRIRVKKSNNFTTINNEFVFNRDLSLKAKGLLCHLLALPNDWKLYVEEVEKWHKDGKSAIYSAFKELTTYGYMKREQIRDDKGKIKYWNYIIFEKPFTNNQDMDYQDVENQALLNTNNKLNTNNTKIEKDYPIELNLEAWNIWIEFRKKEFRTSYKTLGENAAINKILRLSDGDYKIQADIIQQSMENSWKGLFAVKEKQKKVKKILDNYKKGLELIENEQD